MIKWLRGVFARKPRFVIIDCVTACRQDKCPKWLTFKQDFDVKGEDGVIRTESRMIGKCADAWLPLMVMELRQEMVNVFGRNQKSNLVLR